MASNDALKTLKELEKYFGKVAASAQKLSKAVSKKDRKAGYTDLKKAVKAYDYQIKTAMEDTKTLEQLIEGASKHEIAAIRRAIREKEKKNKKDKEAITIQKKYRSSTLKMAKEYLKMQLLWYPIKSLTFSLLAIPRNVISSTVEYGNALQEIKSVAQYTSAELQELDATITELGKTTKFSITEIAKATKTLVQAGFRGDELKAALEPITQLATGTFGTVEQSTQLFSTIIRAFHQSTIEFSKDADILANAIVNTKLSLEDLNVAFGYVASAAEQTGLNLTETVTLLGTLANAGLKASTAATGLRMMLLKLAAPTRKGQKILEQVGLSPRDLDASLVGIKQVLINLKKLSRTQTIEFFGARSANAVLALQSAGNETIALLEKNISKSGTAAQMAREQLLSVKNSWLQFKNAIIKTESLLGGVFSKESGIIIRTFTNNLNQLNDTLIKGIDPIKKYISLLKGLFILYTSHKITKKLLYLQVAQIALLKKQALAYRELAAAKGEDWAITKMENEAMVSSLELKRTMLKLLQDIKYTYGPVIGVVGFFATMIGEGISEVYDYVTELERYKTTLTEISNIKFKLDSSFQTAILKITDLSEQNLAQSFKTATIQKIIKDQIKKVDSALKDGADTLDENTKNILLKTKQQLNKLYSQAFDPQLVKDNFEGLRDELVSSIRFINHMLIQTQIEKTRAANVLSNTISIKRRGMPPIMDEIGGVETDLGITKNSAIIGKKRALEMIDLNKKQRKEDQDTLKELFLGQTLHLQELNTIIKDLNEGREMTASSLKEAERLIVTVNNFLKRNVHLISEDTSKLVRQMFSALFKASNTLANKLKTKKIGIPDELISVAQKELNKQRKAYKKLVKAQDDLVKQGKQTPSNAAKILAKFKVDAFGKVWGVLTKEIKREGVTGHIDLDVLKSSVTSLLEETFSLNKKQLSLSEALGRKSRAESAERFYRAFLTSPNPKERKEAIAKVREAHTQFLIAAYDVDVLKEGEANASVKKQRRIALDKLKQDKEANKVKVTNAKALADSFKEQLRVKKQLFKIAQDDDNLQQEFDLRKQILDVTRNYIAAQERLIDLKVKSGQMDPAIAKVEKEKLQKQYEDIKEFADPLKKFYNDIQESLRSDFNTFFDSVIDDVHNLGDAFEQLGRDILKSMSKVVSDRLAKQFMQLLMGSKSSGSSGMFGGTIKTGLAWLAANVFHKGGEVGKPAPMRAVNPALFIDAPKFHSGLFPDEFPAILQKGETVLPRDTKVVNSAPKVTINMKNESGHQVAMRTESTSFDGEEYIVNTIIKNAAQNGALRALL